MKSYDFPGDADRRYGYVTARVLLAAVFLFTGYAKLADTQDAATDIAEIGLPLPVLLAVIAGVVELVCGVLLVLGKQSLWAAVGLLLFLMPVTVLVENPFGAELESGLPIDFLKNLSIMGGLVMVVLRERQAGASGS